MSWNSLDSEMQMHRSFASNDLPLSPSLDDLARATRLAGELAESTTAPTAAQAGDNLRDEDKTRPAPTAAQADEPTANENQEIETDEKPTEPMTSVDDLITRSTAGEEIEMNEKPRRR